MVHLFIFSVRNPDPDSHSDSPGPSLIPSPTLAKNTRSKQVHIEKKMGKILIGGTAAIALSAGLFSSYKSAQPYDHAASEAAHLTDWSAPPPFPVFKALTGLSFLLHKMGDALTPPPIKVLDLTFGFTVSQVLYVAARLDIADLVAQKPMTALELSQITGADEGRLRRVINACVAHGVFALDPEDPNRYVNSALSAVFRKDHPHPLRNMVLHQMGNQLS